MFEDTARHDEERLRQRLRYEASLTRPAFSQRIHERLQHAIRQRPAGPQPRKSRHGRDNRATIWAAAALAAAVFIPVVIWQSFGNRSGLEGSGQTNALPGGDSPADAVAQVSQLSPALQPPVLRIRRTDNTSSALVALVDSALASRRWAYLDQDVHQALLMLADRVPVDVRFLPGLAEASEETGSELAGSE